MGVKTLKLLDLFHLNMEFRIVSKGMDKIMKSIDKFAKGLDPQELTQWSKMIETMAKQLPMIPQTISR